MSHIPDWSWPIIGSLVVLVLVLWLRGLVASARARRLARQHARVVDDLAVLQSALVPDVPDRLGGLAASVAYRPADGPGAGGDFYDAFELGGGRVAIIAGDASGHGRDAIARATSVRYRLRAYLEIGLSPREALRAAGRVLADEDGEFATAVLAIHDPESNVLTYACAGHPPPIIAGMGEHDPITVCSSPPIGWGLPTGVRQTSVTLAEGSRALFFTDGMIEARRRGEMLGRDELTRIVHDLDAGDSARSALDRVRELADETSDDMAALLLVHAVSGAGGEGLRVEELELDQQDLRRGRAETFLDALGLRPEEVLRAMRIVHVTARGGRPVLVRAEIRDDGVTVEGLERLGEEVAPPPFIQAAPDSRVEFGLTAAAASE